MLEKCFLKFFKFLLLGKDDLYLTQGSLALRIGSLGIHNIKYSELKNIRFPLNVNCNRNIVFNTLKNGLWLSSESYEKTCPLCVSTLHLKSVMRPMLFYPQLPTPSSSLLYVRLVFSSTSEWTLIKRTFRHPGTNTLDLILIPFSPWFVNRPIYMEKKEEIWKIICLPIK